MQEPPAMDKGTARNLHATLYWVVELLSDPQRLRATESDPEFALPTSEVFLTISDLHVHGGRRDWSWPVLVYGDRVGDGVRQFYVFVWDWYRRNEVATVEWESPWLLPDHPEYPSLQQASSNLLASLPVQLA